MVLSRIKLSGCKKCFVHRVHLKQFERGGSTKDYSVYPLDSLSITQNSFITFIYTRWRSRGAKLDVITTNLLLAIAFSSKTSHINRLTIQFQILYNIFWSSQENKGSSKNVVIHFDRKSTPKESNENKTYARMFVGCSFVKNAPFQLLIMQNIINFFDIDWVESLQFFPAHFSHHYSIPAIEKLSKIFLYLEIINFSDKFRIFHILIWCRKILIEFRMYSCE